MFFLTFVDLDECQSPDACGANDVCNNTIGSYRCECANGFVADSGAQDPLNPVCIGKKMDNQKMAEKKGQFQSLHQDYCPHSNKYSTLPSYISFTKCAIAKINVRKLEIEVHIAGEKCFATRDILTSWHQAGPHPSLA